MVHRADAEHQRRERDVLSGDAPADFDPHAELVGALRVLADAATRTLVGPERMRAAALTARALAADLAAELHPTPWRPLPPGAAATFSQHANPLLPELAVDWAGERLVGRARLLPSYGGPPGLVHGGILALMFDQVLGMLLHGVGRPSLTANLSVDYLAGTPLETDLELVGEVTETAGRRSTAVVTIGPPGTVTARATGTMVTVRPVGPDGRVSMSAAGGVST